MNNLPYLVVGLWFLPLVVYAIIPLLFACGFGIVRTTSILFAPYPRRGLTREFKSEQRAHRRIHADDLLVDISDGVDIFKGLVCNVSNLGICLMGIPEKLFTKADRLAVVVKSRGETYSLHILPKWQKKKSRAGKSGLQ